MKLNSIAIQIAATLVWGAFMAQPKALAVTVDTAADVDSLAATNGNKVAWGRGRLHMVYVKGGAIYYASSLDSLTWTAGVALPGTAGNATSQPVIAAASDGTLGVVYKEGFSTLRYQSCKPAVNATCTAWKGPFWVGLGSHPSLTAFQTDMYLTAASGGIVTYLKFAASSTSNFGNLEYVFYDSGACYQHAVDFPSITVVPVPGAANPEIRVSWLQTSRVVNCGGADFIGVFSAKRKASAWSTPDLFATMQVFKIAQMVSLSATANPATGEQFVAASFQANNSPQTMLFRRDPSGSWNSSTLLGQLSLIDIETGGGGCSPGIRVAYTLLPSSGNYGNTFYRTGSWTAPNTQPKWSETPVLVSTNGTSPQASFWTGSDSGPLISLYQNAVPVFFGRSGGGTVETVELRSGKQMSALSCL